MHHLSRLDKAFLRKGIQLSRANNIVSLSRPSGASARVLLPDELPLEEKAVTQLLDFAEVKLPDHPGYVRQTCATPDFHPGNGGGGLNAGFSHSRRHRHRYFLWHAAADDRINT